jgi:tetratricopeptide (TPR) repeat protein
VYANYQRNLADIAEVALDAGAGVVLCTLGVNEGDLAPFGSLHPPGFGEEQQAAWQEYFEAGVALEEAGSWTGAIESFSQAEALDGTYAELQFRLGRCARALGRYDEAKKRFALARDLDTLRFRTDSRLNETIRTVATDLAAEGVLLTDADRVLAEASPKGIPGSEFFHDHVHLTFAGNYLVARTLLEKVERALPDSLDPDGPGKRDVLTQEACARRLALTGWDRAEHMNMLYSLMARPPFTNRCDPTCA